MRSGSDCRRLTPTAKRMIFDTRGATAAIFAISLPILVGMGALAVDVGLWSVQKRHAQGAADQAAFSAAIAGTAGTDDAAQLEAKAVSASMGLVDGQGDVTVTATKLNSFDGKSGEFWQVDIAQPQPMGLAAYFLQSAPVARARAVAGTATGGAGCIIGLSQSGNAVSFDNNNKVSNGGCAVYSNSNMAMANNSAIAGAAYVAGTVTGMGSANIGTKVTGVPPIPDPYADVTVSPPACNAAKKITNGGALGTYPPGYYCDGLEIANNASNNVLNLSPGVYYFGKTFNITNNGLTINGTGVTIVLMPGTTIPNLGNNLVINITAPTTGNYAGIAMMGRNLGTDVPEANNGVYNIKGALYFPNQTLNVKNNFNGALCTQLVAFRIAVKNNANMYDQCPGSGIREVGTGKVALLG